MAQSRRTGRRRPWCRRCACTEASGHRRISVLGVPHARTAGHERVQVRLIVLAVAWREETNDPETLALQAGKGDRRWTAQDSSLLRHELELGDLVTEELALAPSVGAEEPSEPPGAGDRQAVEGGVGGDLAPERVQAPGAGALGIAPAVEDHGGEVPAGVEHIVDLDLDRVDAVAGRDVAGVGRGPVDPEARQQRGRHPDGPPRSSDVTSAAKFGPVGVHQREQAEQLPAHLSLPAGVAVEAGDDAGGAGVPLEAVVRSRPPAAPQVSAPAWRSPRWS